MANEFWSIQRFFEITDSLQERLPLSIPVLMEGGAAS